MFVTGHIGLLFVMMVAAGDMPRPLDAGAVYERELHVATDGSDETGTGTRERPFATIGAALRQAAPGVRINVAAGVYGPIGSFANVRGTARAPVAVVAVGEVVIDGAGKGMGLHLSNPRHLVLEGLTIRNTWPHGISIDDGDKFDTPAQYLVLRNLRFHAIGDGGNNDCLKLSGVADFQVLDSEFEGCDEGEAIDMVGAHRGVISGNYFHDMPRIAVGTKGGSSDVLIHGNRFEDIGMRGVNAGGHTNLAYFRPQDASHEATGIRVVANVFLRTGDAAIVFAGCEGCLAAHNTIVEPRRHVVRILEEDTQRETGGDGAFVNNLVVLRTRDLRRYPVDVGPKTRPETFTFGSNLWYVLDRRYYKGPRFGHGIAAETGAVIQQDPLLADLPGGDYHPREGSPAIGAGRALPGLGVPDFDGREFGVPPAIGAFEGGG